jgi:hypothetical protein
VWALRACAAAAAAGRGGGGGGYPRAAGAVCGCTSEPKAGRDFVLRLYSSELIAATDKSVGGAMRLTEAAQIVARATGGGARRRRVSVYVCVCLCFCVCVYVCVCVCVGGCGAGVAPSVQPLCSRSGVPWPRSVAWVPRARPPGALLPLPAPRPGCLRRVARRRVVARGNLCEARARARPPAVVCTLDIVLHVYHDVFHTRGACVRAARVLSLLGDIGSDETPSIDAAALFRVELKVRACVAHAHPIGCVFHVIAAGACA